ncbi:zinc finger protein 728-like [Lutzomyia longipalpis]|uniref:zinc finger protein 728-like n=1 Tax=Lutzomyia longipalpis TaxID=7200 RepID=UPI0024835392|nr:zinc finger protein 728-like [Lutzomyia longipalpis]
MKSFFNLRNLKRHVLEFHEIKDLYKCGICSKDFHKKQQLVQHRRSHWDERSHTRQRRNFFDFQQCEDCGKLCFDDSYQEHLLAHSMENPEKCNICGKVFNCWKYGYQIHMMIHRGNVEKLISPSCKVCGQEMGGERTLKFHMKKIHRDQGVTVHGSNAFYGEEDVKIKIEVDDGIDSEIFYPDPIIVAPLNEMEKTINQCNKAVDTTSQENEETEGNEGSNDISEDENFEEFFTKPQENAAKVPKSVEKFVLCHVCGMEISAKSGCVESRLASHMKKHSDVLNYKCSVRGCYRAYKWYSSLRLHEASHRELQRTNYKCDLCSKSFVFAYLLKKHKKLHHSAEIHHCDICDEIFAKKEEFDLHLEQKKCSDEKRKRLKRKSPQPKESQNSFKCAICNRSYPFKNMLLKHKKTHEKFEEAIKCPEPGCNKSFPIEKYLKIHMMRHNERRFKCANCNCTYKDRRHIKLHMAMVHLKLEPQHKCQFCPYKTWYSAQFRRHLKRHK